MATTEMLFGDHPSEGSSDLQLTSPKHLLSQNKLIEISVSMSNPTQNCCELGDDFTCFGQLSLYRIQNIAIFNQIIATL